MEFFSSSSSSSPPPPPPPQTKQNLISFSSNHNILKTLPSSNIFFDELIVKNNSYFYFIKLNLNDLIQKQLDVSHLYLNIEGFFIFALKNGNISLINLKEKKFYFSNRNYSSFVFVLKECQNSLIINDSFFVTVSKRILPNYLINSSFNQMYSSLITVWNSKCQTVIENCFPYIVTTIEFLTKTIIIGSENGVYFLVNEEFKIIRQMNTFFVDLKNRMNFFQISFIIKIGDNKAAIASNFSSEIQIHDFYKNTKTVLIENNNSFICNLERFSKFLVCNKQNGFLLAFNFENSLEELNIDKENITSYFKILKEKYLITMTIKNEIKVWNNSFECLIKEPFQIIFGDYPKSYILGNKLILTDANKHYEIEPTTKKNNNNGNGGDLNFLEIITHTNFYQSYYDECNPNNRKLTATKISKNFTFDLKHEIFDMNNLFHEISYKKLFYMSSEKSLLAFNKKKNRILFFNFKTKKSFLIQDSIIEFMDIFLMKSEKKICIFGKVKEDNENYKKMYTLKFLNYSGSQTHETWLIDPFTGFMNDMNVIEYAIFKEYFIYNFSGHEKSLFYFNFSTQTKNFYKFNCHEHLIVAIEVPRKKDYYITCDEQNFVKVWNWRHENIAVIDNGSHFKQVKKIYPFRNILLVNVSDPFNSNINLIYSINYKMENLNKSDIYKSFLEKVSHPENEKYFIRNQFTVTKDKTSFFIFDETLQFITKIPQVIILKEKFKQIFVIKRKNQTKKKKKKKVIVFITSLYIYKISYKKSSKQYISKKIDNSDLFKLILK